MNKDKCVYDLYIAMLSSFDMRKEAIDDRQIKAICQAVVRNAKIAVDVFFAAKKRKVNEE